MSTLQIAKDALKKLACLGNGGNYGNSTGNTIAQEALADIEREDAQSLIEDLRENVRVAWLTGVPNFRESYDTALFKVLGISYFSDLQKDAKGPAHPNCAPHWDTKSEAMLHLNTIESMLGGANGPTIRLRAILQKDVGSEEAQQIAAPLTEAEITSLAYDCNALPEVITDKTLRDYTRAVEARHGIGVTL